MATYTKETALYDTGAISGAIDNVQNEVDSLDAQVVENNRATFDSIADINRSLYGEDNQSGLSGLINNAVTNISNLSTNYNIMWNNINGYMEFGEDSMSRPVLTLGSKSSSFRLNITNDAIQFTYGGDPIAYLTGTALRVQDQLSFGNFVIYQRANGHFTIKYIGEE